MAAVTFVPFVVFFSFPWIFVLANQDIQEVTVKPGEDVTLQCQVHESRINSQLLWRSGNPGSRKAVFVCREKHSYEEYQDPSFRGRVELRDPEIKNGDFSVILKNVTINDTGTYECDYSFIHICIGYRPDPISTIKLTVTDSESKAKAGDDVTLQCQGPRDNITELEWSSLDPKSAGYVFFFSRDDRSHKSLQLPSFRGRVKLRDPEMKDGDASVVLKNVTTNDSGTYECRVSAGSSGQREIVRNFIITLTVTDPRLKAKAGDDVTLQCQGPRDNITELEWSSLDLKSAGYVFFFSRDNRSHKSLQLPSFRGRVELRDPEMKDGDTSVVLKNVTTNDTGTYECRVSSDSTSEGDTPDPISTIKLTVTDPGLTAGRKDGGNKDGGNKDGRNKDGGNMDGGNKDGRNKDGGNMDGGNMAVRKARNRGIGLAVGLSLGPLLASVVVIVVVVVVVRFISCRKYKVLKETNLY
ncbi:polymeric immunoglobulin receptor-like [Siniperca chuatsi]|uniref:polymeric immunoglobulin receptor-like n=1 Tax=Siniperca chuatsi TaxID=119488 RepID=UPI001CE20116|nr:polymeric immunoglobulin receptor-like [Siniperca chuatsi]